MLLLSPPITEHKIGIEPNYILGDLDSLDPKIKKTYKDKIIILSDQNENDLRKSINWAEN